ncbi:MAG: gliding motility-associated C-terminal domain-containing protein [Bacteroidetes bacterium]|nr:gliding motility-associated C-terminal domain-containing protein [Bacteroidota bacterium]
MMVALTILGTSVFAQTNGTSGSNSQPRFDKDQAYQNAVAKGIPTQQIGEYIKKQEIEFNNAHHIPNSPFLNHTATAPTSYNSQANWLNGGGSTPSPQNQYCPNAGFEMYNFTNWTGEYGTVSNGGSGASQPTYNMTAATIMNGAGINVGLTNTTNYHTIMTTPATNSVYPNCAGYDSIACRVIGTQTVSEIPVVNPNGGGGVSVRMNGAIANYRAAKLNYNMSLNPNNKRFSISYALVLENGGHLPEDQPYFSVKVTDQSGNPVPGCSIYTVTINSTIAQTDPTWQASAIVYDVFYRPWYTYNFDFTNYPSITSVNVEFYVGGCAQGGHYGYAYVDAECGAGGAITSFCAGSTSAVLSAPANYSTYQWIGPTGNVPAAQGGTSSTATISPVTAGQVYTCNVTAPNGCLTSFQTTVAITTVSVPNVSSNPSCLMGFSGSATAYPTGSNLGYNYSWYNSSGATVGNSQTANNLSPGVYSVSVSSPGCGSATSTVAVGVSPPVFMNQSAPFCGNTAWINASGGANYKWYNGTGSTATLISGANTGSLTVSNPVAGNIYTLVYDNSQGCKDSIKYTLTQVPGGFIYTSGINGTCPGTSIGTAAIHMNTSASAPYSYTITGTGGYNNTLTNTTSLVDSVYALGAGTYTATAIDGVCQYVTTFSINPIVVSFTATPSFTTVCSGANLQMDLSFTGSSPTACGISTSGCSAPNQAQVGTGAVLNTNTTWPAPYGNWYTNARHQFLFLASELQAAGIGAGKISSLSFMVSTINGLINYPNYTISMKCTPLTALPTTNQFETGLSQVYTTPSYNVVSGWNTHNFQQSYDWDGVSNVIVEICYSANPFQQSNYTYNSISPQTPTPFVSSKVFYSDSDPACGPPVPASYSWVTYSQRPNVKFGFCSSSINPSLLTFNWAPGTYLSNPAIQNPVATPLANITYTATAFITSAPSCSATSVSTVNVTTPVTPTINPVSALCNNATSFSLSVTPTGGAWVATAPTSTAGVFTPSLATIGTNTVTYNYGATGCSRTATTTISIEKFIPSTITGSISPLCITGNTVNLNTLPQYTTGVWSGSGVTGSTFNPGVSGAGSFVLTYSTTSAPTASLCPSTSTLNVNVSSVQQPTATPIGPFCNNYAPQNMIVSPVGGTWSGTGVTSGGVFTPASAAIGTNNLVYTLVNGPCTATVGTSINVEQFVPATLTGGVGPYCIYDPSTDLQPLAVNAGGTWVGSGMTGSVFTPSQAGVGTFTIQYNTSTATATLCPDNASIQIIVNPKPEVTALSDKQDGCNYPLNVAFYTTTTNTGLGHWDFGDGNQSNGLNASNTYTNPGSYQATFYYEDMAGCKDTTQVSYMINVYEVPDAHFDADPGVTTIIASEVHCTNMTSNLAQNTYFWTFGSAATSTDVNPTYTFLETGQFNITLIATSPQGCLDTAVVQVTINPDVVLYVPNAFTANGDGKNDVWLINLPPTGVDFSTVKIQVFDRWGERVFYTQDVNVGWTGAKNNSGPLLKQDVYVWKVTFEDNNRKFYEKLGQVTLLH